MASQTTTTIGYASGLTDHLIHEGNKSAIMFADHPGDHRTTKHIDTKVNFAREAQTNGFIKLVYVPTAEQLADGMTKALPFSLF